MSYVKVTKKNWEKRHKEGLSSDLTKKVLNMKKKKKPDRPFDLEILSNKGFGKKSLITLKRF